MCSHLTLTEISIFKSENFSPEVKNTAKCCQNGQSGVVAVTTVGGAAAVKETEWLSDALEEERDTSLYFPKLTLGLQQLISPLHKRNSGNDEPQSIQFTFSGLIFLNCQQFIW